MEQTLEEAEIINVFERLNFKPQNLDGNITCTIPSYRKDIAIEEDLIEEVIRIVGYDVMDETLPLMDLTLGNLNDQQLKARMIEDVLLGFGADQILSYTLVDESKTVGSESLGSPIRLANPISDKRAYLRTHLLPSMVEVLAYNNAHKISDVLFFEQSSVYAKGAKSNRLGVIGQGSLWNQNWTKTDIPLDFYTLKGMIMELFEKLGFNEKRFQFKPSGFDDTKFHPFKSAEILFDRKHLGVIGQLHPLYAKEYDLKDPIYLEIDLDYLLGQKAGAIKATSVAKYPIMTRDLAILCDNEVAVSDLIQSIEKVSRKYLVDLNVFDVFTSEKLGNKKSIAFQLSFGQDRTLEVEEINDIMSAVIEELKKRFNVEVR